MNLQPIYEATAFAHGFAPKPAPCPRCTPGSTGRLCNGCVNEVAANLRNDDDPLVSVFYGGHGLGHTYRADVNLGGVA